MQRLCISAKYSSAELRTSTAPQKIQRSDGSDGTPMPAMGLASWSQDDPKLRGLRGNKGLNCSCPLRFPLTLPRPHPQHPQPQKPQGGMRARGRFPHPHVSLAVCACSLACVSVAACLNFQARRSRRARFSESSEPKGRFGRADPHCRGEPSSQHARQPGSAAAQGPRRCRFLRRRCSQACCRRCFRTGLLSTMFSERPAVVYCS